MRMIMATDLKPLFALKFVIRSPVGTLMHFIVQWRKQLLDQSVGILAVQVVGASVPATVILHVRALLGIANKVEMRWTPEILLSMCIMTIGPFMFLIDMWTKAGFVTIDHKLFDRHLFLMLLKIQRESCLRH